MEAITIPHVRIPSINIGGICLPGIGAPGSIGKKGLIWPAGMKEHIKAWYDPKKQGMTNFDVIEAYVEDFSKNPWNNKTEKYVGNLTSKALTVTEVLVRSALIYTNIKPYNFKVRITGLINNQKVIFGDDTSPYRALIVDKDGIYDINWEDNHKAYCIWIDFIGECNITITQLPTSILKDFSGNGNHAYLYGGKGKLNSGMGVYQQDFSNVRGVTTVSANGFELFREGTGGTYLARISIGYWNNKECKLLFETNNTSNLYYIRYRKANNDIVTSVRLHNGENIIPAQDDLADVSEVIFEGALRDNEYIRVTEIPDCPDQLCYDGKMYAVCYGFPILTDYTVMAERTWFERQNRACFLSKITTSGTGAFGFEFYNEYNEDTTYSFGRVNNVEQFKDGITYQITNSYNGIVKLDYIVNGKDNAELYIGKLRPSERPAFIGCHGAIIIADRSFTEEEINWLKQNWDKI
jgi:hypothetical protein|nr:MAG TPA: hypothetical protein [Bacteriophage sp.]